MLLLHKMPESSNYAVSMRDAAVEYIKNDNLAEGIQINGPREENGLNMGFLANLSEIARNVGQNTIVTINLSLQLKPNEYEAVADMKG